MAKQFNGVFRAWMKVRQADPKAPPLIWGQCVVHLSNPEFSGNVLHTSGVLEIAEHKAIKIAETRNNFYALLGPELSSEEHTSELQSLMRISYAVFCLTKKK